MKQKKEKTKVVVKSANNTFLDVRQILKYVGEGKNRKTEKSSYAIYHSKHKVKDGFKKSGDAEVFIAEHFNAYDKKKKLFKE